MNTLTLTIKKRWFDKIMSGEKEIEYREIKEYYNRILGKKTLPLRLVLRAGYSKISPKLECVISKIIANIETGEYELYLDPGSPNRLI